MRDVLRIGEVAARAGVNLQTLRYYERRGILREPERTAAGYRQYPADTVRLIRFIKRAQDLGFTLTEIGGLIRLRQSRPRSRAAVRALAASKIGDIDEKMRRLLAMRNALKVLVESCTCKDKPVECPILEALDDEGPAPTWQKRG